MTPESVKDVCKDLNTKLLNKIRDIQSWNRKLVAGRYLSQLQFSEEVKSLENNLHELNQNIAQCLMASESFDKTIAEKESNVTYLNQKLQGKLLEFEKKEKILHEVEMLAAQLEKGKSLKRFSEEEHNKMKEVLSLYNDRLSFKIDFKKEDAVLYYDLKFTNIDGKNIQRLFSVKLRHDSNTNHTRIIESCPEVNGKKEMEDLLRKETDWHKVIVMMRKLFKDYAAHE